MDYQTHGYVVQRRFTMERRWIVVDDREDPIFVAAHDANTALRRFMHSIEAGSLALNRLNCDAADPLVCEVMDFVKAYKARYGDPVR